MEDLNRNTTRDAHSCAKPVSGGETGNADIQNSYAGWKAPPTLASARWSHFWMGLPTWYRWGIRWTRWKAPWGVWPHHWSDSARPASRAEG